MNIEPSGFEPVLHLYLLISTLPSGFISKVVLLSHNSGDLSLSNPAHIASNDA